MEFIELRGVRTHNLTGIDLDIPLDRRVALVGVSGSGKSSLLVDTLAATAKYRSLAALHGGEAGFPMPPVDYVSALPPVLTLGDREPLQEDRLGDLLGLSPVLESIVGRFGRVSCAICGTEVSVTGVDSAVATLSKLQDGEKITIEAPLRGDGVLDEVARAGFSRVRVGGAVVALEEVRGPVRDLRVVVDRLVWQSAKVERLREAVQLAAGVGSGVFVAVTAAGERAFSTRPRCASCGAPVPPLTPALLRPPLGSCANCGGSGVFAGGDCGQCGGSGRSVVARGLRLGAGPASDGWDFPLRDLPALIDALAQTLVEPRDREVLEKLRADLLHRLGPAARLGLDAYSAGARLRKLPASAAARARLARLAATRLEGALFLLDEPTSALSTLEARSALSLMQELGGRGILWTTHRLAEVRAADWVIEFGPGAGTEGGNVIFAGTPQALADADTPTGRWLRGEWTWPARSPRPAMGAVAVGGRALPLGQVVIVREGRAFLEEAAVAARAQGLSLLGWAGARGARSSRSMPATYAGLWTPLRALLAGSREALVRGLGPSAFSLNTAGGRCEVCKGLGVERIEMGLLPPIWHTCAACNGRRFQPAVLGIRWRGYAPDAILDLSASAFLALAGHNSSLAGPARALVEVGLGYLPLGQPGHTLSGGEARRLALARELNAGKGGIYLLESPEAGLHGADRQRLAGAMLRLVEGGATLWVATEDPEWIAWADAMI